MQTSPVSTEALGAVLAFVSTLSIASERAVAVLKNFLPWLREEKPGSSTAIAPGQEELRRLTVLLVSYGCSLSICHYFEGGWAVTIGSSTHAISAFVLAFLALGGSAFWAQIIGVLSAIKDVQKAQAPVK